MKPVVMFVDDELNVLTGLERNLHKMRKKWDMVFYADPMEALDHMADGPIDLVVSDLRMPGMDGVEFLGKVAERAPRTIRFGLSERSDQSETRHRAEICHQILTKPCDTERLVQHAQRALDSRDLIANRDLQTKVSRIQELPSRPEVHDLIIKELTSRNWSFESIAALVSEDVALAAKVLQIASSDFFSTDGETPGLVTAVTRLGVQRIKAVVRSHGVETACAKKVAGSFSLEALWLHSIACATVAQAIARFETQTTAAAESAFVAGLVHDIGRLVMAASEPERYAQMLADIVDRDGEQGLRAETRIFKSSHPRIGAYLVGLWGFSDDIVHAVAYHHAPSECPVRCLGSLAFLHAGEAFCRISGADGRESLPRLDMPYFETLGVEHRLARWQAVADGLMTGDLVR